MLFGIPSTVLSAPILRWCLGSFERDSFLLTTAHVVDFQYHPPVELHILVFLQPTSHDTVTLRNPRVSHHVFLLRGVELPRPMTWLKRASSREDGGRSRGPSLSQISQDSLEAHQHTRRSKSEVCRVIGAMPDVHNGCATVATSDNPALRREDEVLQPLLEVANRYVPWAFAKPLWIVNWMTQHCLCLVSVRVMSYYHAGRSLSPTTRRNRAFDVV